jgi:hypothetical protein
MLTGFDGKGRSRHGVAQDAEVLSNPASTLRRAAERAATDSCRAVKRPNLACPRPTQLLRRPARRGSVGVISRRRIRTENDER